MGGFPGMCFGSLGEHFYDPSSHSAFLELRLRNTCRKLEAGKRRYTKCKISCDTGPGTEQDQDQGDSSVACEWITLMKRLRPFSENIPSIKSAMEQAYSRRRSWIMKGTPTIAEIFDEYPCILDMPCLLDVEFGKMTNGKTDLFIRRWEANIIPKLKAVAAMERSDVASLIKEMEDQTDDEKCYTALVVLTHLLPPLPGSRCSVKCAISFLRDFVPAGTSIASLCSNSETSKTQPQLICIGSLKSTTRQYIIIARNNRVTIPASESLTCTVDMLFKLYWVCNVAYPPQLSAVFSFFEYIYDVTTSTKRKAKIDCKGEPVFGEIIHIIPQADNVSVLMFVRILKVKYFDDHFYAFVVEPTKEYKMISLTSAADARPFDIMLSFNTDELYVNPSVEQP
ncbi:uncharacterized protein LOC107676349 [Sinocyclocheilus anshuiensis]|uniref:uncharacterized protein LOC107676349 n=1 Tax=Sinocyclocheilus anshuiensis TaxID=1608454 RepID=UPI0007B7DD9D|nr:PREDICTED: uncharacterized protein LOC107676349 [Sinocyclocheilus anshuiensis]